MIDGTNFNDNTAVVFQMGNEGQSFTARPDSVTSTELDVKVPDDVTLGLARVSLVQATFDALGNIVGQGTLSNPLFFTANATYAFSAQPVNIAGAVPEVSVVDADPTSQAFGQRIDTIAIQGITLQWL